MKTGDKVIVYSGPAYGRVHIVERLEDSRVVVRLPFGFYVQNHGCMALSVPTCDCEPVTAS
jgi:hypothetical protein